MISGHFFVCVVDFVFICTALTTLFKVRFEFPAFGSKFTFGLLVALKLFVYLLKVPNSDPDPANFIFKKRKIRPVVIHHVNCTVYSDFIFVL